MSSIIIPWRDSGSESRLLAFKYILKHMEKYNPIVIDDKSTIFSRSGSRNLGASISKNNPIMFLDADMLVPHNQIDDALDLANDGCMVQAFTDFYSFDKEVTNKIYKDNIINFISSNKSKNFAVGGAICMTKDIFFDYGGYDINFIGWGYEDSDLLATRESKGIKLKRVDGFGGHLWHSREEKKQIPLILNNQKYFIRKHGDS